VKRCRRSSKKLHTEKIVKTGRESAEDPKVAMERKVMFLKNAEQEILWREGMCGWFGVKTELDNLSCSFQPLGRGHK